MHFEKEEKVIERLENFFANKDNKDLVDQPININKDTMLHFAYYHKKSLLIDFLQNKMKANQNLKNNFGLTPKDLLNRNVTERNEH